MTARSDEAALIVANLSAGYNRREVVRGVSLEPCRPGETIAIVGPNAAGKSTLLKGIAGLAGAKGTVRLGQTDLLAAGAATRADLVGFMPQALPRGVHLTVFESVVAALKVSPVAGRRMSLADAETRAAAALDRAAIADSAFAPLDSLSGGQRQLAAFAQAIVRDPRALLLDEPTSALDLRHQAELVATTRRFAADGGIVLAVLHDLGLAARWADRIAVLRAGALYAQGHPEAVLTPELLAAVYGVAGRVERCSRGSLQVIIDGPLAEAGSPA